MLQDNPANQALEPNGDPRIRSGYGCADMSYGIRSPWLSSSFGVVTLAMEPQLTEIPDSLFLAPWFLWVRAALASAVGYHLCRHRHWIGFVVACMAGYWAYKSIRLMVDLQTVLLNAEGGLRYMFHAYAALIMPFAFMLLGLALKKKGTAEPGAAPNVGPSAPVGNSGATEGPPSVS
jgi:hypothetical protein